MAAPTVTVIGAGIVGAAIAHALSRTAARVRLIDARQAPGRGVTGRSFGWVNYVTTDPTAEPGMYRHRRAAFAHHARLNRDLGGRLHDPPRGSLVWSSSAVETERMVARHAAMGSPTRLVDRTAFARLAPPLAVPPERAAYSPDDFALNPDAACERLVGCAVENGLETVLGQAVEALETTAGRVTGVRVAGKPIATDIAVVAAGTDSQALLSDIAPTLGITASPAALITISAETAPPGCILSGPELEVRARGDKCLLVASGPPADSGAAARRKLGERKLAAIARLLPGVRNARVRAVEIGRRPATTGGRPLVGRLAAVPNLFVAVAHPGVILAPAIARTIAELVFDRPVSTEIGDSPIGS